MRVHECYSITANDPRKEIRRLAEAYAAQEKEIRREDEAKERKSEGSRPARSGFKYHRVKALGGR